MKVFSIQHEQIWHKLQTKKKVFADNRYICAQSFKSSYEWYIAQAKIHCPLWEKNNPFWVWTDRPDLRHWKYFKDSRKAASEPMVLLELEINPQMILLSDFSLWHFVLNKLYLPYTEDEDNKFSRQTKDKNFEDLTAKDQARVRESWQRCLKLKEDSFKAFSSDYYTESQLQGIVPFFHLDQVLSVTRFVRINKN